MRRAGLLSTALFLLASVSQGVGEPNTSFLKGLMEILGLYGDLRHVIDGQISDLERRQLAGTMQNLADGFYQLRNEKSDFTRAITAQPLPTSFSTILSRDSSKLLAAIRCLQANLSQVGLAIKNQTSFDGIRVEGLLRAGLSEKANRISELAREWGLNPENEADAIDKVQAESKAAEDIADKLANESIEFTKQLDPTSSPPEVHRPCVMPAR
jgi:hypothetical protein